MPGIPDFTDAECQLVARTLDERYGCVVELEVADVDLKLNADSDQLTTCPALYWSQEGTEFVVCKAGSSQFRPFFFHGDGEQFGTGRAEYENLGDCVVTLLQVEAERHRAADHRGGTFSRDDYTGPIVI